MSQSSQAALLQSLFTFPLANAFARIHNVYDREGDFCGYEKPQIRFSNHQVIRLSSWGKADYPRITLIFANLNCDEAGYGVLTAPWASPARRAEDSPPYPMPVPIRVLWR